MFFFWEVCLFVCECSSAVQRDRGKASGKGCKVDMIVSPGRMIDYESRGANDAVSSCIASDKGALAISISVPSYQHT